MNTPDRLAGGVVVNKNGITEVMPLYVLLIRQRARPCWNGGIWYKRTHGTEYRSQWP